MEYVRNYRAPSGRTEEAIAEAYEKVLEVSPVGAEDSFFELGGDSLHISEVICEIEERLPGVSIDFSDVFSYPTPELLAQHLKAPEEKEKETSLHHLDYRGIRELLSGNRPGSGSRKNLGNILLTGVTGFLGIHILTELLKHPDSWNRIWCLVRPESETFPRRSVSAARCSTTAKMITAVCSERGCWWRTEISLMSRLSEKAWEKRSIW